MCGRTAILRSATEIREITNANYAPTQRNITAPLFIPHYISQGGNFNVAPTQDLPILFLRRNVDDLSNSSLVIEAPLTSRDGQSSNALASNDATVSGEGDCLEPCMPRIRSNSPPIASQSSSSPILRDPLFPKSMFVIAPGSVLPSTIDELAESSGTSALPAQESHSEDQKIPNESGDQLSNLSQTVVCPATQVPNTQDFFISSSNGDTEKATTTETLPLEEDIVRSQVTPKELIHFPAPPLLSRIDIVRQSIKESQRKKERIYGTESLPSAQTRAAVALNIRDYEGHLLEGKLADDSGVLIESSETVRCNETYTNCDANTSVDSSASPRQQRLPQPQRQFSTFVSSSEVYRLQKAQGSVLGSARGKEVVEISPKISLDVSQSSVKPAKAPLEMRNEAAFIPRPRPYSLELSYARWGYQRDVAPSPDHISASEAVGNDSSNLTNFKFRPLHNIRSDNPMLTRRDVIMKRCVIVLDGFYEWPNLGHHNKHRFEGVIKHSNSIITARDEKPEHFFTSKDLELLFKSFQASEALMKPPPGVDLGAGSPMKLEVQSPPFFIQSAIPLDGEKAKQYSHQLQKYSRLKSEPVTLVKADTPCLPSSSEKDENSVFDPAIKNVLPLYVAGLYVSSNRNSENGVEGEDAQTTTGMITQPTTEVMSWLHGRMPLILTPMNLGKWLDPTTPYGVIQKIIRTPHDSLYHPLRFCRVTSYVNNTRNQSSECLISEKSRSLRKRNQGIGRFMKKISEIGRSETIPLLLHSAEDTFDEPSQRIHKKPRIDGAFHGQLGTFDQELLSASATSTMITQAPVPFFPTSPNLAHKKVESVFLTNFLTQRTSANSTQSGNVTSISTSPNVSKLHDDTDNTDSDEFEVIHVSFSPSTPRYPSTQSTPQKQKTLVLKEMENKRKKDLNSLKKFLTPTKKKQPNQWAKNAEPDSSDDDVVIVPSN